MKTLLIVMPSALPRETPETLKIRRCLLRRLIPSFSSETIYQKDGSFRRRRRRHCRRRHRRRRRRRRHHFLLPDRENSNS